MKQYINFTMFLDLLSVKRGWHYWKQYKAKGGDSDTSH